MERRSEILVETKRTFPAVFRYRSTDDMFVPVSWSMAAAMLSQHDSSTVPVFHCLARRPTHFFVLCARPVLEGSLPRVWKPVTVNSCHPCGMRGCDARNESGMYESEVAFEM